MACVGYARVSTPGQSLGPQLDALGKAGSEKIFEDHAGSAKTARPGLDRALVWLRDGDTLVVWKLDRLGRSMPHLIERDLIRASLSAAQTRELVDNGLTVREAAARLGVGKTALYEALAAQETGYGKNRDTDRQPRPVR